jgi:ribosomal 30S subunit maturation factor RimM
MADPLDASEIEDGENVIWVHELVGSEVRDVSGALLGPVVAVEDNPASALMVVSINGDEVLVPVVFIVENSPGVVVINPPEGLLDLGKSS